MKEGRFRLDFRRKFNRNEPPFSVAEKTGPVPPESHATLTIEKSQTFLPRKLNKYKC